MALFILLLHRAHKGIMVVALLVVIIVYVGGTLTVAGETGGLIELGF